MVAQMKLTATPLVKKYSTEELNHIKQECEALMKKNCMFSAGAAIIPVPFLDMAIDAGILTQLLPQVSAKFGLSQARSSVYDAKSKNINWPAVRSLGIDVASVVAKRRVIRGAMQNFGTRLLTKQVTKFVPFGGQLIAATIGYTAMKKIAQAHINECYNQALQASKQNNLTRETHDKTPNLCNG
jgi:uncharacterized protein (DUF697 family)